MRVTAVVSQAGLGAADNDDCAGFALTAAGLYAWVIDGATSVAERDWLGAGRGDVAWYSNALSEALRAAAADGLAPRALHAAAVRALASDYRGRLEAARATPPLHARPMAALTLLRVAEGRAELFHLGDCAAFALAGGGVRRLSAAEKRDTAVESRGRIEAVQRTVGFAPKAIWEDRLPALRRERDAQLSQPVLNVSTPDVTASFGGHEASLDLAGATALVLMSDGYERFAETYDLGDAATMIRRTVAEGPERLLAELRGFEAADADCRRAPRLKPSDDATCLVIGG